MLQLKNRNHEVAAHHQVPGWLGNRLVLPAGREGGEGGEGGGVESRTAGRPAPHSRPEGCSLPDTRTLSEGCLLPLLNFLFGHTFSREFRLEVATGGGGSWFLAT